MKALKTILIISIMALIIPILIVIDRVAKTLGFTAALFLIVPAIIFVIICGLIKRRKDSLKKEEE
jgi:hypothetical protein